MERSQQYAYLKTMGIPVWMPRKPGDNNDTATYSEQAETIAPQAKSHGFASIADLIASNASVTSSTSDSAESAQVTTTPVKSAPSHQALQTLNLDALETHAKNCQQCSLHKTRTQVVFASGVTSTQLMIIGEAPSADEDQQGHMFVGKQGLLLKNMLKAIGLSHESVYITHLIKCRPLNNRPPDDEELLQCQGYLNRQIALIKPAIILAIGRIAAQHLLGSDDPLPRLRGKIHQHPDYAIPIIASYHPEHLLIKTKDKAKAWQDLQLLKQQLTHINTQKTHP